MASISRGRTTSGKVEQLGEERRAKVLDPCLAVVVERKVPLVCRPGGGDLQSLQQLPRRAGFVKRTDTPGSLQSAGTSPPGAHSDVEAHGVLFRLHGFPELEQPLAGHRKSRLLPLQEPRKRKSLRPSLCPAFTIEDLCLLPYGVRRDSLLRSPQSRQGSRTDPPAIRPWQNPPVTLSGQEHRSFPPYVLQESSGFQASALRGRPCSPFRPDRLEQQVS